MFSHTHSRYDEGNFPRPCLLASVQLLALSSIYTVFTTDHNPDEEDTFKVNAFELLKTDHEKVSGIFERIEATDDADNGSRQALFAQVKSELEVHTHIEETIFYPALKQAAETREIVVEAISEHQEVKDLLAEITGLSTDSDEWSDKIADLKEAVEHHVEEEEGEMFDKARDVLSRQQIDELGERMAAEKKQKAAVAS